MRSIGNMPNTLIKLITIKVSTNKEIAVLPLFLSHNHLPSVSLRIHKYGFVQFVVDELVIN